MADITTEGTPDKGGEEKVVLRRSLGLMSCIGFVLGIVIGTGIFISPKGVLLGAGGSVGWALIIWTLCGLISTTGALCYVELITCYTKSGGEFTYLLDAFGQIPAFLRMWTLLFLIGPSSNAVQSLTIANYITAPFFGSCEDVPQGALVLIAICVLFLIFFINCISVQWTARLQVFFTIAKVFGLVVLIITGLVYIARGYTSNLQNAFEGADIKPSKLPLAIYSGIFAYSGWDYVATLTEEVKTPEKTVPRSVVISMAMIIIIYLLANIGYFALLTPTEILGSSAVGADFGQVALGRDWSWLIWLFVALSASGNLNGAVFGRTRIFFVAAREGMLPDFLSMIHINHRTPLPAIAISLPLSILYMLVGDVLVLVEYLTFVDWTFSAVTIAIIPYYRWKYKSMNRPFKVPLLFAIIFILFTIFVMGMTFYSSPWQSVLGLVATFAGIPVYFLCVWWKNKPRLFLDFNAKTNVFFQKLFLTVRQEEKTY